MAVDPVKGSLANVQTMAQYTYCLNNPIKYVDPLGLASTIPWDQANLSKAEQFMVAGFGDAWQRAKEAGDEAGMARAHAAAEAIRDQYRTGSEKGTADGNTVGTPAAPKLDTTKSTETTTSKDIIEALYFIRDSLEDLSDDDVYFLAVQNGLVSGDAPTNPAYQTQFYINLRSELLRKYASDLIQEQNAYLIRDLSSSAVYDLDTVGRYAERLLSYNLSYLDALVITRIYTTSNHLEMDNPWNDLLFLTDPSLPDIEYWDIDTRKLIARTMEEKGTLKGLELPDGGYTFPWWEKIAFDVFGGYSFLAGTTYAASRNGNYLGGMFINVASVSIIWKASAIEGLAKAEDKMVQHSDMASQLPVTVTDSMAAQPASQGADYYVTPKGDVLPGTKTGLNDSLSMMENVNGKYVGDGSGGPVRVRIENAHPQTNIPAHLQNPYHEVPHIHVEYRQNTLTGEWGKGLNNNFTLPQSLFR